MVAADRAKTKSSLRTIANTRIMSLLIPSVISINKRKPLKRSNFKGFGWRSRWDSNPRGREAKRFSRPPRYDRFDTAPCPRIISKRKASFNICGLYYRESALPFTVEILYRRLTDLSASRSTDTAGCDRDPCVSS